MTTGERIQEARKKAKLSQRELGERLGVSASMIGQYENNLRNPKLETLFRISTALNVPFDSLLSDGIMSFDSGEDFLNEWNRITSNTDGDQLALAHKADGTTTIIDHRKEILNITYNRLDNEDREQLVKYGKLLESQPKYRKQPRNE